VSNPVLFQALPPLSPEEYRDLEQDILANGILVPIIVDENGVVIDGHHRQKIAKDHNLPCPSEVKTGFTDTYKRSMALSLNINRRHLTREQHMVLINAGLDANKAWLEIVMAATDLVAWTKLIGFTDQPDLARCEIDTFRYRVLHVAARITRSARQTRLAVDATWRWAKAIATAWTRIRAAFT
jgi:DDE family transposase/ParB-like nuclease family protein